MTTRLEKIMVMAALWLGMAPFALYGNTPEALDATLNSRLLLWAVVYAGFAGMALVRPGIFTFALTNARLLLGLTALTTFSALWSVQPGLTLSSSAALWATTLIGIYIAYRFEPRELMQLLAGTIVLLAVGSALVIWLMPDYGTMAGVHEGLWNGLTTHKNALGRYMVMGVFILGCLALDAPRLQHIPLLIAATVCFALMLGTESATAYVLLIVLTLLYALMRFASNLSGKSRYTLLGLGLCIVVSGALILLNPTLLESAFAALGRDPTLTHRTRIWSIAFDAMRDNPWLGYGYEAFWSSEYGSSFSIHYTTWIVPHVHNGFLEVWLALGIPGLLILIAVCLKLLRYIFVRIPADMQPLFVLTATTSLVLNLVEFNFLRYNNIFWLLFIYVLLRLPLSLRVDARLAPQPG